jgi:hypothetical protein
LQHLLHNKGYHQNEEKNRFVSIAIFDLLAIL